MTYDEIIEALRAEPEYGPSDERFIEIYVSLRDEIIAALEVLA